MARRERRISSSVLPENMEPEITVKDPVLSAGSSSTGLRICIIAHILLVLAGITGVSFGDATIPPAPQDGGGQGAHDDERRSYEEEAHVLGRPTAEVRVEKG